MSNYSATEDIVSRLVHRVEGRYYGKYRGQVTDNADPDNLGRIKANVPRLLGTEETGWALPAFIYGGISEQGLFAIPDIGAGVWIEFEEGDLSYPIWSGTWYTTGAIPESAKPAKKVFKTKSGHKMIFDDDAGTLEITDKNQNTVTMDSNTIKVAVGQASKIIINAPNIELVEKAPHPLVFGDDLVQYLNQIVQIYQSHTHPGQANSAGVVSPTPPTPSMPGPPNMLSTKVKTG